MTGRQITFYKPGMTVLAIGLALTTSHSAIASPAITHGVASGDVTHTSAIVWSRADRDAEMVVRFQPVTGSSLLREVTVKNSADIDFTAQIKLSKLQANTQYRYEVSFKDKTGRSKKVYGSFRTAPDINTDARVSLIWSGDLAGQKYCRKAGEGYKIFKPMTAYKADFFVANGDMIYADDVCPKESHEKDWKNMPGDFLSMSDAKVDWTNLKQLQDQYNAHWQYNRADPSLQDFFVSTPMYSQWDDHEILNDFGGSWINSQFSPERKGYQNVIKKGAAAFFNYHPIDRSPKEPNRIYRSFRWGKNLELFILDARSYRSENTVPDVKENNKTMLGAKQFKWLQSGVTKSTATWKIISSDVPLAIATGHEVDEYGNDSFADGRSPLSSKISFGATTGFESELLKLLRHLDKNNINNVVFITTDIHFAGQIRYENDFDGDGDTLVFHEMISGPLSALRNPTPPILDHTLHPTYLYAEGDIFNFGTMRVSSKELSIDIRDETGRIRPGSARTLIAK